MNGVTKDHHLNQGRSRSIRESSGLKGSRIICVGKATNPRVMVPSIRRPSALKEL